MKHKSEKFECTKCHVSNRCNDEIDERAMTNAFNLFFSNWMFERSHKRKRDTQRRWTTTKSCGRQILRFPSLASILIPPPFICATILRAIVALVLVLKLYINMMRYKTCMKTSTPYVQCMGIKLNKWFRRDTIKIQWI